MDRGGQNVDTQDKTRTSQTLARGLQVLGCYRDKGSEYGIKELSFMLALPSTVVSRLVATLVEYGYLYQNPDNKKYRLGLTAFALGLRANPDLALQNAAYRLLQKLSTETNETVSLNVMNPATLEGVCIVSLESSAPVKLTTVVGSVRPLHRGATRKVLLAHFEPEELDRYLEKFHIEGPERQDLVAELDHIRTTGYAYSEGELDSGAYAIAAPILSPTGRIMAGVAVAGPLFRLTEVTRGQFVEQVKSAAWQIRTALGSAHLF